MGRKVKWALLAMLGFATACSTVKNNPKQGSDEDANGVEVSEPQIQLMYGVRNPVPLDEANGSTEEGETPAAKSEE